MELILAGGLAVFSVALRVAITLLNLIGMYRIFQKMGMPGWKGLVPIYNNFNLYGLLWDSKFFWLQLIASFCVSIPTNEESPLFLSCHRDVRGESRADHETVHPFGPRLRQGHWVRCADLLLRPHLSGRSGLWQRGV